MIRLKQILTEQKSDYLQPYQADNPANTGKVAANLTPDDLQRGSENAAKALKELDPHTVLTILQFITPFIPVVGWFAAAGIGLANAAMYAGEGDTKQAGIETIFALLPGVGKIVQKIPAIGKLGARGMASLGRKLATSKSPMLNKFELHLIKNLASPKYKDLIKADLTEYFKARAKNEAALIAKNATKSKGAQIASKALNKLAGGGITLGKFGAETAADVALDNTALGAWDKIYSAAGLDAQPSGNVVLDPAIAAYAKDPEAYLKTNQFYDLMK
jgi:hypothetical protein